MEISVVDIVALKIFFLPQIERTGKESEFGRSREQTSHPNVSE
jgi:hypothetical protein